jgi:hypothetical protein
MTALDGIEDKNNNVPEAEYETKVSKLKNVRW